MTTGTAVDERGMGVIRVRVQQQSRVVLWVMLVSMACTFASQLFGDPDYMFGGPFLRIAVLCGSGVLLVVVTVLLVLQRWSSRRSR